MKIGSNSVKKEYSSFLPAAALLLLIVSVPDPLFGSTAGSIDLTDSLIAVQTIITAFLHLLLTILGALVIICTGIIYFSLKLKRINRELTNKNESIEQINSQLQKTNEELESQKDQLTRKYYESDKFFRILIQSADDGISFYDSEWNLKFANQAFYSVIGYDRESYHSTDPAYFFHPDDKEYPENRKKGLKDKGVFISELRLRHKDGHYLTFSTRSVVVRDEG